MFCAAEAEGSRARRRRLSRAFVAPAPRHALSEQGTKANFVGKYIELELSLDKCRVLIFDNTE